MAPKGESERDHQQKRGEQAPGQVASRGVGARFQAAEVLGIFARSVFAHCDFRGNGRGVAGSFEVLGNGLIFIEANEAGIGADKALIEDASGQLIEPILFQCLQHARADLGGAGNLLQCDLALLALQFQFFAKGRQTSLPLLLDANEILLCRAARS
jgi:hypothetical protein